MLMPKCSPLIERPARAAASSITTRPAAASSGVHSDGSHPSDNRPQRSSAAGTVPPSQTSSGCCTGRGESLTSLKLPAGPSWLTASPAHRRRKSGSAAALGLDTDGLALRRVGEPRNQRDEQPPPAQDIEARELLGEPHHIAPRQ